MKRCQSVYVGVVDVSSLPEQRCHLLPVSGGAGGHKHSSLSKPDSRSPRRGTAPGFPGLWSCLIRLRAQPSLQLILATLFGSFGPGMVSGRHLPWSVPVPDRFSSWYGKSGVDGLDWASPGLRPLVDRDWRRSPKLPSERLTEWQSHVAFKYSSEIPRSVEGTHGWSEWKLFFPYLSLFENSSEWQVKHELKGHSPDLIHEVYVALMIKTRFVKTNVFVVQDWSFQILRLLTS